MNAAVTPITLTTDQQAAFDAFVKFLLDPYDDTFVLAGYSGTGKTTLVCNLLERLPKVEKMYQLIDPDFTGWEIVLTATTNKAAEAFSQITKLPVRTIHSLLGLRVVTDPKTRKTSLSSYNGGTLQQNKLIFIDEASFADRRLLKYIAALTHNCKVVFMGDPAQLTPIESADVPVFTSGYKGAHLSQVVRQAAGNPIIEIATAMRNWVNTGEPAQFSVNGNQTQWMPRDAFEQAMKVEFTHPDWKFNHSKYLAWTNKACIRYNHMINEWVKGTPDFEIGDYAINNRFLPGNIPIKTDQMVHITSKESDVDFGVPGFVYRLDTGREVFLPDDITARERVLKQLKADGKFEDLSHIEQYWADLRSVYACTINKAQGSTYRKVFLDLDDIAKCHNMNQIARMLYVGISRASETVIFTGDLI